MATDAVLEAIQNARAKLDNHAGQNVYNAQASLDVIEAHAEGEDTAEAPKAILQDLADAENEHLGLDVAAEIETFADYFNLLDLDQVADDVTDDDDQDDEGDQDDQDQEEPEDADDEA